MQPIRRHLPVWCLLTLVLLAPLAAPVGAAGNATIDGTATTASNFTTAGNATTVGNVTTVGNPDTPGNVTAAADTSTEDEHPAWTLSVTDAVGNVTNETRDVVANATNVTLGVVESNGTNRTDQPSRTGDGPSADVGHDGTSPATAAPDQGTNLSLSLLRPELPRLAVTDSAVVVELRPLDADDPPTVTVPLAVDGPSDPSAGDGADPSVDRGESTPSAATTDDPDDGPTATATPTPDAANGSADAGDVGAGGGSASSGDVFGFDAGPSVEFVPPLGTALFVVAARPWLGLLSAVAGSVANWVGNAFVLLRYCRHDGSDPLEHETRERIHDRVSEMPGRTLTELSESLETPLSTVRHHVRVLERERVVVSRKLRGNRRIYPIGAENAELAAALEEDSTAAVIAALHEQGRATVGEVVDRVERSYSTVSYHLSRLADEGLVVQERDGRKTLSRLDPDVESLLDAPDDPVAATSERSGQEASAD